MRSPFGVSFRKQLTTHPESLSLASPHDPCRKAGSARHWKTKPATTISWDRSSAVRGCHCPTQAIHVFYGYARTRPVTQRKSRPKPEFDPSAHKAGSHDRACRGIGPQSGTAASDCTRLPTPGRLPVLLTGFCLVVSSRRVGAATADHLVRRPARRAQGCRRSPRWHGRSLRPGGRHAAKCYGFVSYLRVLTAQLARP